MHTVTGKIVNHYFIITLKLGITVGLSQLGLNQLSTLEINLWLQFRSVGVHEIVLNEGMHPALVFIMARKFTIICSLCLTYPPCSFLVLLLSFLSVLLFC